MKRALPWILICLVAGSLAAGLYALVRRHPAPPPAEGPAGTALFKAAPAGAGALFSLQPAADQPLRSVRFLPALAGGEVLAQVLTQTGEQLLGQFKDGQFTGSLRLEIPEGAPAPFFRFARLLDAAVLEDGSFLLLYGDGAGGGSAPWLLSVDPAARATRWGLRGSGARIALEPGGHACLLWDGRSLARATWGQKPALKPLALPGSVSVIDAVLPMPGGRILLAHPGGLAMGKGGAWTLTPLPEPGDLAFPGAPGVLARSGESAYWQPRPGQLARIGTDGVIAPVELSKLAAPGGRERDLALLRLAGADARGALWFSLLTPDFTIAPHPAAAQPSGAVQQPSAALQAAAAMAGSAALHPAPDPAPGPAPFDPGPWMDYLKTGLDRVYAWNPSSSALRLVDWKARWPALGAPADLPLPLPRNLQPQGGALLEDLDTRAWWLPLEKAGP